ncbi:D-alanyl-D-alanine carboxypeptidase family protein [Candidatus Saccharibacteria bacterium]|nr:D-alanyl-D-alanine carboxypeptidase family protein [Candidatus Saccharibacteria bacterium]
MKEKRNLKFNFGIVLVVLFVLLTIPAIFVEFNAYAAELHDVASYRDYLIVVNRDNEYDFNGTYEWQLQGDLTGFYDVVDGDWIYAEKATLAAFSGLQAELSKEGVIIGIFDAYHSRDSWNAVYTYYSQDNVNKMWQKSQEATTADEKNYWEQQARSLQSWIDRNPASDVGFTEHHTGLLLNIVLWYPDGWDYSQSGGRGPWYTETPERSQSMPIFGEIHEKLADFGFIDRYPAGKESYTGVMNRPNEIRFVGSPEIAHAIMDNGLCLEEYLGYPPIVTIYADDYYSMNPDGWSYNSTTYPDGWTEEPYYKKYN